jgi:hypothetical protein
VTEINAVISLRLQPEFDQARMASRRVNRSARFRRDQRSEIAQALGPIASRLGRAVVHRQQVRWQLPAMERCALMLRLQADYDAVYNSDKPMPL